MKKSIWILIIALSVSFTANIFAQNKDKGHFVVNKNEFWQEIKKGIEDFNAKPKPVHKVFKMDMTGKTFPTDITKYKQVWHLSPISQGNTGTCWSYSTTSFYESEVKRLHNKEVRLSPIWNAYWEFVEKAKRFVETRGHSYFAQGSEGNAVARLWKKYGVVPMEAYPGLLPGQIFHDHSKMFAEMKSYLDNLRKTNAWNEEENIETIKAIMNHYITKPPEKFTYKGKEYTPKSFLKDYLQLNMDDYVEILSLMEKPYWHQVEYNVPDNWWHSADYYNVPLDVYMKIIKKAIRDGYSMAIGGDVSEAGYESHAEVAVVPTFDIPSDYIDENARQFRFSNGTTTDDHGIHLVGYYTDKDGKDWYLIKDSGSGSRNGKHRGYYFYSEDYVKLKIMGFTINKNEVLDILKKFKND
jgi:bleomycin hydrolase